MENHIATELLPQINQLLSTLSPIECWQYFTQHLLKTTHPWALHQLLYTQTFADWDTAQGPPPAWFPTPEQIRSTNIAALMREQAIATYPELHAWSCQHRDEFWHVMIQRLGIRLQQNYTQILDLSQGVESPQWLVDARFNIVESCFRASDNAIAIIYQPEGGSLAKVTYGELHALANRVSNGLVELGLQPGDAIAVVLPMTVEAVAIYLGIVQAGCVVVSIADSFAAPEIAIRLKITQAKVVFTQGSILRAGKQLPLYPKVIEAQTPQAIVFVASNLAAPDTRLRSGDLTWQDFLGDQEQFQPVVMAPSAHTNILFSSGTTGKPKAIPWTQTTPIKCAVDGHLHQDIHVGDVVAWPTSLGWMMGPWLIYASLINQAAIALYYGSPTTREFGQFIQDARVTMLGVVPSLVTAWKITDCMRGLDWSVIKAFSSTGECSNPQDMLFLMSLAGYKPIVEYCGGTEIGGGYITGTLVQPCAPATFTTPALGLDIAVLDIEGQLANKGEAFIIPPSIGLSTELLNRDHHQVYFADTPRLAVGQEPRARIQKPVADSQNSSPFHPTGTLSANIFPPSFLLHLRRHGDRLERLSNGYYRAQGRADDAMNLGGIKVSSTEIEQVLNAVEDVCETAAIAISPYEGGPSQLIVYVVLSPNRSKTKEELKTALQTAIAQNLNPLFKIHDVVMVNTLPRTASNKVMRRVLRDQCQDVAPIGLATQQND
uniref:AMP-binding protein n=1 Tax=Trichocoleus desertorum TaxID=1481672 RepID=UPI0025B4D646|nr:AMP-binding protein [Trichocoleus desertorum]